MVFAKPDRDIKVLVEEAPALLEDPPQLSNDEHNVNTTKTKSTTVVLHHDHINQMPVEILHAIFLLVQTVSLYDPFSRNETGVGHTFIHNRNPPLSISQVCRYWRACALAMKELWRHIYVCDEHVLSGYLVGLFLERSSPLSINFLHHTINEKSPTSTPGARQGYYEAINAMSYNSIQQSGVRSRIRSISFHTNKNILLQPVWALLTGPLPNVVDVDIRFSHLDDLDEEGELIHPEKFLQLLQGCAPRLRRLSLIDSRYDSWLDDRFEGLVELHLTQGSATLVEFDSFVSVLEKISTNLEVLCLRNAVPYPYVPFEMGVESLIPDDDDKVKMPKLRHLEIWGDPTNEGRCFHGLELFLLWILDIPHTAAIVWEADMSLLNSFVTRKYNIPPKPHLARITSLVTSAYKKSCFAIAGSTFYLDPRKVDADDLESWISILPNFVSGTT